MRSEIYFKNIDEIGDLYLDYVFWNMSMNRSILHVLMILKIYICVCVLKSVESSVG